MIKHDKKAEQERMIQSQRDQEAKEGRQIARAARKAKSKADRNRRRGERARKKNIVKQARLEAKRKPGGKY
jgi:hypothetical protein